MKKLILSLTFIFSFGLIAQSNSIIQTKEIANVQIKQMKSGKLLVRLYNKSNVIKALEEKGMVKRAKAVKRKQKKINKEIVAAFKEFKFCDVYFFFSDQSEKLIKGEYSKVTLFSDTGMSPVDVTLDSNYFVVDFGVLSDIKTSVATEQPKKSGITKKKRYKGTSISTSMRCMYLRNNKLEQLKRPFPYYVRFHPSPLQDLTYKEVVTKMNKQLVTFYSK